MKFIALIVVCCFCLGLLGCSGGGCATPPDIRFQWPVMLERTQPSVPGPRLVPQTYYAAPQYAAPTPSALGCP